MLKDLEKQIQRELQMIEVPGPEWTQEKIALVGAGMAGLAVAFQLYKLGIRHVVLFDQNKMGAEGPWVTFARMKMLRSGKDLTGPAFDFPSLTFRAWFTALHGEDAWQSQGKIANGLWMDYLNWFRGVLNFDVRNNTHIDNITAQEDKFLVADELYDRVILATGRGGFGGCKIPSWAYDLPAGRWAHTSDPIDFTALKGKRLLVVGAGASAFDAAATALEAGVKNVDLLCRRETPGTVNKLAHLVFPGFFEGFYALPDRVKCEYLSESWEGGAVPPIETIERVIKHPNFLVCQHVNHRDYDFVIFGTGFEVDVDHVPELNSFKEEISTWEDHLSEAEKQAFPFAQNFPFLDSGFQFTARSPKSASLLHKITCFNWSASLSHGMISSDIPGIGYGARRLAIALTADIFSVHYPAYLTDLKLYDQPEYDPACLKRGDPLNF